MDEAIWIIASNEKENIMINPLQNLFVVLISVNFGLIIASLFAANNQ